jgi:hypothetical protein
MKVARRKSVLISQALQGCKPWALLLFGGISGIFFPALPGLSPSPHNTDQLPQQKKICVVLNFLIPLLSFVLSFCRNAGEFSFCFLVIYLFDGTGV